MSHIPSAVPIPLVSPVVVPPVTIPGSVPVPLPVPIPVSAPIPASAPAPVSSSPAEISPAIGSSANGGKTPAIPNANANANSNGGGPPSHVEQQQALDLASYVYNAGFIHAAWADTFLTIGNHPPLRLHALFVSRSPLLYRYLSSYVSQGPPYHINISVSDANITTPALSIAFAMLYGHFQDFSSCGLDLAKGLVATGSLLGLENVSGAGYAAILNLLNDENLQEILDFALSPQPANQLTGTPIRLPDYDSLDMSYEGPYPPTTVKLLAICVDYMFADFSVHENSGSNSESDRNTNNNMLFESVLLRLPFNVYKFVLESERLVVRSAMERHQFATRITGKREQLRKANRASDQVGAAPVYEESVVMSFGGGNHGMRIIRKQTGKKKTLWKANQ